MYMRKELLMKSRWYMVKLMGICRHRIVVGYLTLAAEYPPAPRLAMSNDSNGVGDIDLRF